MADVGVALDTETHQIQPGLPAPPLVCGSVSILNVDTWAQVELAKKLEGQGRTVEALRIREALNGQDPLEGDILTKREVLDLFLRLIRDPERIIIGANIAYDLLVLAVEWAKLGVDVMGDIFQAFEDQRIFDIQVAEALHAIAGGHLDKYPNTGKQLVNRETGKRGSYSLDNCVELVLGRTDAKDSDEYRTRYAELENVPIPQWPEPARVYPVHDAKNTEETGLAQCGLLTKISPHHVWGPNGCTRCGASTFGQVCTVRERHRNLCDHANQVWTAFCLHLGGAWGFKVDQYKVDVIETYTRAKRAAGIGPFKDAGVIRPEGTVNEAVLKGMVARAYGATRPCRVCTGTGKILAPNPRKLQCPDCRGRSTWWKGGGQIKAATVENCARCANDGKIIDERHRVGCKGPDGETTCDSTGLELPTTLPRSDTGRVGKSADTLHSSGDEFVMSFGDFIEDNKWQSVYIPYLRRGRKQIATGGWIDIPLTLRYKTVLETGRVSVGGSAQQFPRWPGFVDKSTKIYIPSFRECIIARPGWTFSSEDYRAGELVTHAQSCKWIVGFSDLGDVLLSKDSKGNPMDPHSMLASTVLGVSYEEFIANKKLRKYADARQASKPENFGKPGGMGDPKLVLQQRRQGPDTPHPTGPSLVEDENGNLVPGYHGLRFCLLMGGDGPCGGAGRMAYEHNDKPIAPVCAECLECAVWLGQKWKTQWRENQRYFNYISDCVDNGQRITWEMLQRWPHLQEWFTANDRLAPGEIMQHVVGRIRGGVTFTQAANGFFQGLLADITKHAYRIATRECYVRSVRVPDMLFPNSRRSRYTGMDSPLYGSRIPGFYHDELFGEHPTSMASDGAWRISEIMGDVMRWYCPDYADAAEAEPTLMPCWDKRAAKVIHNDRLAIWTPKHDPKTCGDCADQMKIDAFRMAA